MIGLNELNEVILKLIPLPSVWHAVTTNSPVSNAATFKHVSKKVGSGILITPFIDPLCL